MNFQRLKKYISLLIPAIVQNNIKMLFVKKGKGSYIIRPFRIDQPQNIDIRDYVHIGSGSTLSCYHGQLVIGDNTYVTKNLNLYCGEKIIIGDNVLIASYVLITDSSHRIDLKGESMRKNIMRNN